MGGISQARHNLGIMEENNGNTARALKHYKIVVDGGNSGSLKNIQIMYTNGFVTKDD